MLRFSSFRLHFSALALLLALLLLCTPVAFAAEQKDTAAEEYTGQLTIEATTIADAASVFQDANRSTGRALPAGEIITLQAAQPVSQLYIVWDIAPDSWRLICGGETLTFANQENFIHQYVELPAPVEKITLQVNDAQGVLCDIYAFGAGETPDWVQKWQQPWERADLLCMPTHADDEHLFLGGTMPYYAAERGYRVQVAYLANHNGEPYRPHELLNGLWTVGIRAYPVISNFPDQYSPHIEHARTIYNEEDIKAYQTEVIRRFRPYVVVGHDVNGEYGHGMHCLNGTSLLEVAGKTGDPDYFPESAAAYGVWELPKLYLHLYPENEITMDWDIPLEAFDGKTAYQMACEGYACHVSQQSGFQMGRHGIFDNARFGLAHTTVGPDVEKNDFFEHIVFEEEQSPQEESFAAESTLSALPESAADSTVVPTGPLSDQTAQSGKNWIGMFVLLLVVLLLVILLIYHRRSHRFQ